MNQNIFLFKTYLETLKYPITDGMFHRLLSDPNEGVLPITNTLDFFNIEHVAAIVPKDALSQLPNQFVAQISNDSLEKLILATKQDNGNIKIQVDDKKDFIISDVEFIREWTGFILAIERNENRLTDVKQLAVNFILIVVSLFAASSLFINSGSVLKTGYFTLSIIGVLLSYFIVKEKFSGDSAFSKLCQFSRKTDCQSVLSSNASKLFGSIDLGDVSVIYFLFLTLTFIYNYNSIIFFYCSVLSLPLVIYSLYHQYFNIKKWCPLCLGVSSLLLVQFFIMLSTVKTLSMEYVSTFQFVFILSILTIGWYYLKPFFETTKENSALKLENLTFRRNHKLFLPYYNALEAIDLKENDILDIRLGVDNPIISVTAITNPLCNSCLEAYQIYTELLHKYPDQIQLNFRFLVPTNNRNDNKTKISERLLQLYTEESKDLFKDAFNDWHAHVDSNKWLGKWKNCEDVLYSKALSNQTNWCLSNGINSTPRILINAKLFPESYHINDIKNFIDPIIELEKNRIDQQYSCMIQT